MFVVVKKCKLGPSILLLFPGKHLKQDTQNWNEKNNGFPSTRKSTFQCVKVYRNPLEAVYIRRVLKTSLIYHFNNLG